MVYRRMPPKAADLVVRVGNQKTIRPDPSEQQQQETITVTTAIVFVEIIR